MLKKYSIFAFILLFSYSNFALAETEVDPEFLKPDTLKEMLSVATEKSKEHMESIAKLYREYKNALTDYAEEYLPVFQEFFTEEEGNAKDGYIPVKNIE